VAQKLNIGIDSASLPDNDARSAITAAMAKAFEMFGDSNAFIMMIVQANEGNVSDQRQIEYTLWNTYEQTRLQVCERVMSDADGSIVSYRAAIGYECFDTRCKKLQPRPN